MSSVAKPGLLLVDDEPDMLDFLQRVLRTHFRVIPCSSPDAALERLDGEADLAAVVSDQKMPRMSGLEFLAEVARRRPDVLRLLVSGFAEVVEMQRAIDSGVLHNFIVKPVDTQAVLAAIEDAYRKRDG